MFKRNIKIHVCIGVLCFAVASCKLPAIMALSDPHAAPVSFDESSTDSSNTASMRWQEFFTDPELVGLIDTALLNNQELKITMQEIEVAKNDIRARKGELLPIVGVGAGIGVEKVGRYTSAGAGDASTEIKAGKPVPEALMDYRIAATANWEVDIWKKLRNAKKATIARYLSSVEGKNFAITNLVAEVANSYYELLALDNQLAIVRQSIGLQNDALEIVKAQKEGARATELAVQKFQAEVLKSRTMEFDILQQIKVGENRINFLLGRYPQPIPRHTISLLELAPAMINTGIPSQLLVNRPDIRQAELELQAARLDLRVARAEFYPRVDISAALGFEAFKPSYLLRFPESVLYSLAGDLAAPLINRSAIKASFSNANSRQLQALYNYERTILNGYMEVSNGLSNIGNLEKGYELKLKQVDALTRSIDIANDLFKSARADYFEVLMTQRDALEAKLELIETKKEQFNAVVNIYRSLGGGWR